MELAEEILLIELYAGVEQFQKRIVHFGVRLVIQLLAVGAQRAGSDLQLRSRTGLAGEELDAFAVRLHNATVDKAILKRLGDAPFSLGRENITSVLSTAYDVVHTAVVHKIEEIQSEIGE